MTWETDDLAPLAADALLRDGYPERRRLEELAASDDRRRALLADPSMAVRDLPAEEFSGREIEDLKRTVLEARRLREMEYAPPEEISHRLFGLAVALILGLLFVLPSSLRRSAETTTVSSPPALIDATLPVMTHSSVEAFGLPGARIYELADEDFSLVLVVDESFEL